MTTLKTPYSQLRPSTHALCVSLALVLAPWLLAGCECGIPIGADARDASADAPIRERTDECGNGLDDDRNGLIDDGCPCAPGEMQRCFSGPNASDEVGACGAGTQTCVQLAGSEWGDWGASGCEDEVLPGAEVCDGSDADCDGAIDEGCPCTEGESRECGLEFLLEPCRGGTQSCRAGVWSGCEGAIGPTADVCTDAIDNDCDGVINEGCACVPEPEICRDGIDNDCDGVTDEPECRPDWPRDAGMPVDGGTPDAMIPPPPTCEELADATGSDWTLTASAVPDGTGASGGTGVRVTAEHVDVDAAGNVYVMGQICDGDASVAGFAVSSHAVVSYARLTCNVFMVSLTPTGTLRYGWNPVLEDLEPPPPMAGGPYSYGEGLAADGAGGVWMVGGFAGKLTVAPGRQFTETTADMGADAFLIHVDASGAVREAIVVGELGTSEGFREVMVTRSGEPVVVGGSTAPLFAFGSMLVRSGTGVYVAQVRPSGEPRFVTVARPSGTTGSIAPGRLSADPSGNIVLAGGSNGAFTFGSTALPSATSDRGHAWLWTLAPETGATVSLRSWQSSVGYYAHAQRARVLPGFTGMSGNLRGQLSIEGVALSAGMGAPEDPVSGFVAGLPEGMPPFARSLAATPFDAFHGLDTHFDWNACRETLLVAEGLQGSSGGRPTPPVSQVDFGAGPVMVPESRLQLVQWSPTGALDFRREVDVSSGVSTVVQDAAWSPRERLVVVALTHSSGFNTSLSIRRFAFR